MAVTSWGKYQWDLQHRDMVNALVVKQNIKPYTIITKDMLGKKQIPRESLEPNTYQDPKQVIGLSNITELWPGEQLLKVKFDEADFQPKPGEVLIGIETDLTKAAGGELNPGDYAEIKVRYKPETGRRDAETVLEKVKIYSIKDANGQVIGIQTTPSLSLLPTDTQASSESGQSNNGVTYLNSSVGKAMPKVIVIRVANTEANKIIEKAGLGELVFAKLP